MLASDARWTFVFSHPNHEIAVFGLMQRLRPRTVYLTDGGAPSRVAATRAALERIGLLEDAVFLDGLEEDFYAALVKRDLTFWRALAERVAEVFAANPPECIATDAVEFYNPVHDMSLPVVLTARGIAGCNAPVYEVPLVRERPIEGGYALQSALQDKSDTIKLSDAEWDVKWGTWNEVHGGQLYTLGELINSLGRPGLEHESIHRARDPLRRPSEAETLRYERRGRLLAERGDVSEVITLEAHVHPVARALLATAAQPQAAMP